MNTKQTNLAKMRAYQAARIRHLAKSIDQEASAVFRMAEDSGFSMRLTDNDLRRLRGWKWNDRPVYLELNG